MYLTSYLLCRIFFSSVLNITSEYLFHENHVGLNHLQIIKSAMIKDNKQKHVSQKDWNQGQEYKEVEKFGQLIFNFLTKF